jgi:hypothetical protein
MTDTDKQEQPLKTEWDKEEELLLKEWAEKAICYKWLHTKSNKKYSKINAKVTIPVIILSTLTGTANFAQERIPVDYVPLYVMVVGSLNIIAGIITTIAQYFKISEINEGHRIAALSWDKFSRNIRIQLSQKPKNRESSGVLMKYAKDEFDRLMEISPDIPDEIITIFKKRFDSSPTKKSSTLDALDILEADYKNDITISKDKVIELINMNKLNNTPVASSINKPDICDNLTSISIYDNSKDNSSELVVREGNQVKQVFIEKFKELRGREPTEEEITLGITTI